MIVTLGISSANRGPGFDRPEMLLDLSELQKGDGSSCPRFGEQSFKVENLETLLTYNRVILRREIDCQHKLYQHRSLIGVLPSPAQWWPPQRIQNVQTVANEKSNVGKNYRHVKTACPLGGTVMAMRGDGISSVKHRGWRHNIGVYDYGEQTRPVLLCWRDGALLTDPDSRRKFPLRSHGEFYEFIPARCGRNPALDNAVSRLCAIYRDKRQQLSVSTSETIRLYTSSLKSLRNCVQAEETRLEPETICSSLILQPDSKLLIQELGPESFDKPFERTMLESQRAFFLAQDMSRGQECFLSQPQ
ncbi:hypothetical protein TSTA_095760 [Talaromyces stipitatus ATCC 10500]|uniref:Uncharacterized protein n=1 Tax=Talaromyces stipitatus (strain ATCC 10500 / CBS 375.48 / QM 6759 / NRRL 1006) TaxID=441959 RepID=B8M3F5_TALSN|nr:uncharacterized protein TSTA_095760 [Talaromyces stipitatus ATCC 10500]EED22327.1 hypothetical protein TSTA_095760 [Talaromyces stipitatus ATCC 10500]